MNFKKKILFTFFVILVMVPTLLLAKITKEEEEIDSGVAGLEQKKIVTTTNYRADGSGDWLRPGTEFKFRTTNGKACEVKIDLERSTFDNCKVVYKKCFANRDGEWSIGSISIEALGEGQYDYTFAWKAEWIR